MISRSSTHTCGSDGSETKRSGISFAAAATAALLARSMPRSRQYHVSARYIAPVSRYPMPSLAARAFETVDLPEPAGPSIAIVIPTREMAS